MLSVILCCAAILSVSTAFQTGAPATTCNDLTPRPDPHGTVEQTTANPWIVDVSYFNVDVDSESNTILTYTPGETYNSKS